MNGPAIVAAMLVTGALLLLGRPPDASAARRFSAGEVKSIAAELIDRHRLDVDPCLVTAVAAAESNFNPRARNPSDPSFGIMQMLPTTAAWLARERGFDAFGASDAATWRRRLLDEPRAAIYLGAAYLSELRTWGGPRRATTWVVQSYNGGPGASSGATREYRRRVFARLRRICPNSSDLREAPAGIGAIGMA